MNIWQDSNNMWNIEHNTDKLIIKECNSDIETKASDIIEEFTKKHKEELDQTFVDMIMFGECKVKISPCSGHAVESEKDEINWKQIFTTMDKIREIESKVEDNFYKQKELERNTKRN